MYSTEVDGSHTFFYMMHSTATFKLAVPVVCVLAGMRSRIKLLLKTLG